MSKAHDEVSKTHDELIQLLEREPKTPEDAIEGLDAISQVMTLTVGLVRDRNLTDEELVKLWEICSDLSGAMRDLMGALPERI
jgi:succinate dehydrogenase/fumarate reductase flavoprotein subunit